MDITIIDQHGQGFDGFDTLKIGFNFNFLEVDANQKEQILNLINSMVHELKKKLKYLDMNIFGRKFDIEVSEVEKKKKTYYEISLKDSTLPTHEQKEYIRKK